MMCYHSKTFLFITFASIPSGFIDINNLTSYELILAGSDGNSIEETKRNSLLNLIMYIHFISLEYDFQYKCKSH